LQEIPWRLAKSLSSKKEREKTRLTVAEGPSSVLSALGSHVSVEFVAVSESYRASPEFPSVEQALEAGCPAARLYVVPDPLFDKMSETRTPQGILCVLPWPFKYLAGLPKPPWDAPLCLCAVDVQDPGNAGTLIRAAASTGATGAEFLGDSVDVFSPKCIRASAGAVFKLDLAQRAPGTDPAEVLAGLHRRGVHVFKAVPRGGEPPWAVDLTTACAVVAGNEARGLRPEIIAGPGSSVSIPMPGGTESLNVALATGMILYEAVRQRFTLMRPR
jgi:TrmH family RNA methyltransferase